MIIECIVLGSVIVTGYRAWQGQSAVYHRNVLARHRAQEHDLEAMAPSSRKPETSPYKRDAASLSAAMILAGGGSLLFPPARVLSIPFLLFSSRKRHENAWKLAKKGQFGVPTLSSLSVIGSILGGRLFIGSLLGSTFILSDWLTSRLIKDSRHQLVDIFQQLGDDVWQVKDGIEVSRPLTEVKVGDILVVSPGEFIPADGKIVWGSAGIDQHQFTGESIPKEKAIGDEVFAMTLVLTGKIHVQVERTLEESSAKKITEILNRTADYKSFTVLQAKRFSQQLVLPVTLAAAAAWPLLGFSAAVGVLFTHPKERLMASAPLSLLRRIKRATNEGILVKDGRSLELLSQVDTLVFDKTGTLTNEQPTIGRIHTFGGTDPNQVLRLAAIAEHKQTHPLARAIRQEAFKRGLAGGIPEASEVRLGFGLSATIEGHRVIVGSDRLLASEGVFLPEGGHHLIEESHTQGIGLILVAIDGHLSGILEILPTVRPEAKAVIATLKKRTKIRQTFIISGDTEAPTRRLAQELGIDRAFAQVLPQQKAQLIQQLQQDGAFVCFVGDGINDSIAMKQAQVSVSVCGASKIASDTSQIVLLDEGIDKLPRMFELAEDFNRHMKWQLALVLGGSVTGVTMIFLGSWGMGSVMGLNIACLLSMMGFSLLDRSSPNGPQVKSRALAKARRKTTTRVYRVRDRRQKVAIRDCPLDLNPMPLLNLRSTNGSITAVPRPNHAKIVPRFPSGLEKSKAELKQRLTQNLP